MAASPFYEASSEISTESEVSAEDDFYEERTDYDFAKRPGSSWTAGLCHIGIEEETLCKIQRVSLIILEELWSATSIESLTEQVLSAFFAIPEVTPMGGLSQQFDFQRERSWITLYVQGRWLCSLLLDITAPDFDSDACTQELEIRVCLEALCLNEPGKTVHHKFLLKRPQSRSRRIWRCYRSCSKLQVTLLVLWLVGLNISRIVSAL